ncbi:hypothetical protein EDB19DRAFT_1834059 [Suillus lakei]|nr:hypothetical protein EDB19DRAFT_1834059 [Suillus lakei]
MTHHTTKPLSDDNLNSCNGKCIRRRSHSDDGTAKAHSVLGIRRSTFLAVQLLQSIMILENGTGIMTYLDGAIITFRTSGDGLTIARDKDIISACEATSVVLTDGE